MRLSEKEKMRKEKMRAAYHEARQRTLGLKPEQISQRLQRTSQVYAALIDFKVPGGSASLVCLLDGTVDFYYSMGGGLLGLGQQHKDVLQAGRELLESAEQEIGYLNPAISFGLDEQAECTVFLLTQGRIYRTEFQMGEAEKQSCCIRRLNEKIQNILKALRKYSDRRE